MQLHEAFRRAWITGTGGLIGNALLKAATAEAPNIEVTGLNRAALDLSDFAAVRRRFEVEHPELIIHCAALSRSTDCEANPELARKLNVEMTALLAELALEGRLVFFSTDLVFDGRLGTYSESAEPKPLSIYGETKAEAERKVLCYANHLIIRTSLNGGTSPKGDRGFNEQMRLAWTAGKSLRLFIDEFRSPVSADITARATWQLALRANPGIYHVAGSERMSRWDIGKLMAARWPELNPRIEPASLSEYKGDPRAPDTSLNSDKAQRILNFDLPKFSDWLESQPPQSF